MVIQKRQFYDFFLLAISYHYSLKPFCPFFDGLFRISAAILSHLHLFTRCSPALFTCSPQERPNGKATVHLRILTDLGCATGCEPTIGLPLTPHKPWFNKGLTLILKHYFSILVLLNRGMGLLYLQTPRVYHHVPT